MNKICFMLALLLCSSSAFDFNPVILIKRALSSDFNTNKKAPGATAGFSRDNRLGVVRDNIYKLMWQDDDLPDWMTYDKAVGYCDDLIFAGYSDWRLPTLKEMLSITDDTRHNPAINKAFKNIAYYKTNNKDEIFLEAYWSSTKYAGNSHRVWSVRYSKDGTLLDIYIPSDTRGFVRCVREN